MSPPDMHLIRLLGPWRLVDSAHPEPRTIKLPLDKPLEVGGDRARLQRNFQRPGRLDPDERMLLILPPGMSPTAVWLGETPVGDPRRMGDLLVWDLTPLLRPSNRLQLDFTGSDWVAGLTQPVQFGILPDADGSWWPSLPRQSDCTNRQTGVP